MSLRLPTDMPPGPGLRAVLHALARQAGRDLEHVAKDPEERIHSLRTGMKKYRAVLRLTGDELKPRMQQMLLERVRILKDGLAGSRDDVVIFKTVRKVLGSRAVQRLGLKLPHGSRHATAPETMVRAADELAVLTVALEVEEISASDLKACWKHSVRQSRRAMKQAAGSLDDHDFHAWRKCVKNVWYQSLTLAGIGERMARLRGPARKLSELLGEEHDLTIVLDTVRELTAADREVLNEERTRLRSLALAMGMKIRL